MKISIVNHKGGTGKTTTTINFGKALTLKGKSVLLIDLDAQANLSYSLGIEPQGKNIGEVLFKNYTLQEAVVKKEGMDILPGTTRLHLYEEDIIKNNYGNFLLKNVLEEAEYDFILIDCPPSKSVLNLNALCASDKILIPMIMDVLSIQGLNQILNTVKEIKEKLNPSLEIIGILGVLVDERWQLSREVLDYVKGNYPIKIFNTYIRANVKAAEAPSFGMSALEYAPDSNAAKDYRSFCNEFLTTNIESNPTPLIN